jgi:hypothetical protein
MDGKKNFNWHTLWVWIGAFCAWVVIGSIYAERAANAQRINEHYIEPDSDSLTGTLPYDTCKIPHFILPREPEAGAYFWK